MTASADIVVIGSGPAGISCCWPLVEAGRRVLLIDPGGSANEPAAGRPHLAEVRAGHAQKADWLLGPELRALKPSIHPTPKLRFAAPPNFVSDYIDALAISTRNFVVAGSLAPGGLSNVWGSVASTFNDADLAGMPISACDLEPSYRAVAQRIGINGTLDDDMAAFHGDVPVQPPLAIGELAQRLLARYRRKRNDAADLRLGLSRNAVLSVAQDGRGACELDGFCMWGCWRGSIYNSAHELRALAALPNFSYAPGCLVEDIQPRSDGFTVSGRDPRSGARVSHSAPTVVIAAGTIASTRLVLPMLGRLGERRRLLTNPGYTFALLLPGAIGRSSVANQFAMTQLSFALGLRRHGALSMGSLYAAECLNVVDIAEQMPLTLRGGIALSRALAPAMLVGLGFFDGIWSDNGIAVEPGDGHPRVAVDGGWTAAFPALLTETQTRLRQGFARLGALLLPRSFKPMPPGADFHYAGTLSMGDLLTEDCEVKGHSGLYVVDGAAFGRLPAKHFTFSVMANADRVGRRIAAQTK